MRAVVTGGAGFLGSHLCKRLLDEGFEVVCADNFLTGSRRNIEALVANAKFRLAEQDVSKALVVDGAVDRVWHLASPASPFDYLEHPIETLDVGSIGTRNALELARAKKARFFLASTSEVYGDPAVHPQPESYFGNVNSIGPRSCYDEAKRFAEALTMAYWRTHGVDTRIVRIFNTYGPAMKPNDGRVVSNLLVQAITGQPLTLFGDGTQTRSFCYVSDLIEGFWRLMEKTQEHEPVNLGNPEEYSMLELARLVKELTGTRSEIVHKPLPQDDPKVRRPDTAKAKRLLGWEARVPVREGLAKTAEYFRSLPPAELKSRGSK
ncbi:MAG TPA: UDP-glucuronic acid decarboxylase family protein [bacterium]|nr:UDP-glucuronic acid decarboxylase family protein [bacterium]